MPALNRGFASLTAQSHGHVGNRLTLSEMSSANRRRYGLVESQESEPAFSELEVEAILRKAIRIEGSRQMMLGLTEIKAIAMQIGVSPRSVDEAVAQVTTAVVEPTTSPGAGFSWKWMLTGSAIAVLAQGSAFPLSPRGIDAVPVLITAVALTAFARGPRPVMEYLVKNASLWVGFAIGLIPVVVFTALVMPDVLGPMARAIMAVTSMSFVQSSLFGSLLVWFANGWKKKAQGIGTGGGFGQILKRRVAAKLEEWIDIYLKRGRVSQLPSVLATFRPLPDLGSGTHSR